MEKKSDQLKHTNTLVKCFCQQRLGVFLDTKRITPPKINRSESTFEDDFPFPKVGYVTG